ncbi:MAG TPA: DEAD/DEAH box helicase [Thermoanaerobaculia bacterium]
MTSDAEPTSFSALGLREELVRTLADLGYEAPTPIQEKTIPILLSQRDLIGQAQTGTGKTAAFALPLLQGLDPADTKTQALVLAPTRELAMQVAEAIHSYAKGLEHISVLPVYGGAPMGAQLRRLERGVHVVVGTPGRIIDHLQRGTLDLGAVRTIVIDEADEMLRMGFIDDVESILARAPEERQVALFSATMPAEILRIAQKHLRDPIRVEIEHRAVAAPAIEQRFLNLAEGQKLDVLTQILELEPAAATLVFRRTRNGAAELAEKLEGRGFAAVAMHGDMAQSLRESVIRRLRSGQVEVVVATDVAARGLDVEQITHVVNYDIPNDVEAYVHRIGRTGRAGRSGVATLFVTPRERRMLREIERFVGAPIRPMTMPTRADVAARRIDLFKESIRKNIAEGDLDLYVALVEQIAEEGEHDMAEIAAAAARLANGSRSLAPEPQALVEPEPERPPRAVAPRAPGSGSAPPRAPFPGRQAAREFAPREGAPSPRRRAPRDEGPRVRLEIGVGSRDGIRPADVVGSIANEANIPGRDIGPIEIGEDRTIVSVPAEEGRAIVAKMAGKRFRGRDLSVRIEGEAAPPPGRLSYEGPRRRESAPRARPAAERSSRPPFGRGPSSREGSGKPASPRGGFSRREAGEAPAPYRGRSSRPGGGEAPAPHRGRFAGRGAAPKPAPHRKGSARGDFERGGPPREASPTGFYSKFAGKGGPKKGPRSGGPSKKRR